MYSLYSYGTMIADTVRFDAYTQALRQAVRPGCVVVDIGTGAGIWALTACRLGARKVYAIEPDDVIEVARETAELNGFGGKIEFIQDLSTRVTLPEPADVMVSDIRGGLPVFQASLTSIADARIRLLAPQGTIIPLRDTMWAAVVEDAKLHESYVAPWEKEAHGFNMRNIRQRVSNTIRKERVPVEGLVTEPQCWAVLDYDKLESYDVCGTATWSIRQERLGHGLSIWFDSTLLEGIGFSNAPGLPDVIYGRFFFPWPEPVGLKAGDTLSVTLRATWIDGDYVWSWETGLLEDGRKKTLFRQSTFYASPISPARLRKRAANYQPVLTEDGEVERFVLTRMDGHTSVEEIARELYDRFIGYCKTFEAARSVVGDVSHRCSR